MVALPSTHYQHLVAFDHIDIGCVGLMTCAKVAKKPTNHFSFSLV